MEKSFGTNGDAAQRLARRLGLHRVSDREPGLRRRRSRKRFAYFYPDGRLVRDPLVVRRIQAMAIPPAYREVWICRRPDGHLQATGRDARGRKQYRYHPAWEAVRASLKYGRMLEFGAALPRIRRRVAAFLRKKGLARETVLAAVVRLLEMTLIRVGNDEYARKNGSYGLTTLTNHHADVSGSTIRFDFRGKGGIPHRIEVDHPALATVVRSGLELPGRELFQYPDEAGEPHTVSSADVNAFLHQLSGAAFTAKDYRTWAGSVRALAELRKRRFRTNREARKHIVETVRVVAERLGNTPAISRKSYIHPGLFDAYLAGELWDLDAGRCGGLAGEEAIFLQFLRASGSGVSRGAARNLHPSRR